MISYAGDHFQYVVPTKNQIKVIDVICLTWPIRTRNSEKQIKKNGSKQNIADCKVSTRKRQVR